MRPHKEHLSPQELADDPIKKAYAAGDMFSDDEKEAIRARIQDVLAA